MNRNPLISSTFLPGRGGGTMLTEGSGQLADWQYSVSDIGPTQYAPLFFGGGFLQSLNLVRSPIPHVFVHSFQEDHVVHMPSTGFLSSTSSKMDKKGSKVLQTKLELLLDYIHLAFYILIKLPFGPHFSLGASHSQSIPPHQQSIPSHFRVKSALHSEHEFLFSIQPSPLQ